MPVGQVTLDITHGSEQRQGLARTRNVGNKDNSLFKRRDLGMEEILVKSSWVMGDSISALLQWTALERER